MLWNELEFEAQHNILLKIMKMSDKEKNPEVRAALHAAFFELRLWSNHPGAIIDDAQEDIDVDIDYTDFAVLAQDPYIEE